MPERPLIDHTATMATLAGLIYDLANGFETLGIPSELILGALIDATRAFAIGERP